MLRAGHYRKITVAQGYQSSDDHSSGTVELGTDQVSFIVVSIKESAYGALYITCCSAAVTDWIYGNVSFTYSVDKIIHCTESRLT